MKYLILIILALAIASCANNGPTLHQISMVCESNLSYYKHYNNDESIEIKCKKTGE